MTDTSRAAGPGGAGPVRVASGETEWASAASASELLAAIDALADQVRAARTLPMSSSVVLHRDDVLESLRALRLTAEDEVAQLTELRRDRDAALSEARTEAARIVSAAAAERQQLLATDTLVQQAQAEADRLLADAREQALAMRREVDDYVDGKLANFEVALTRTLAAVHRGRSTLAERLDDQFDDQAGDEFAEEIGDRPDVAGEALREPRAGFRTSAGEHPSPGAQTEASAASFATLSDTSALR